MWDMTSRIGSYHDVKKAPSKAVPMFPPAPQIAAGQSMSCTGCGLIQNGDLPDFQHSGSGLLCRTCYEASNPKPVPQPSNPPPASAGKFKVGDKLRCIKPFYSRIGVLEEGCVYTARDNKESDFVQLEEFTGREGRGHPFTYRQCWHVSNFELVTPPATSAQLKVGDRVKVLDNRGVDGDLIEWQAEFVGKEVTIAAIEDYGIFVKEAPHHIGTSGKIFGHFFRAKQLELVRRKSQDGEGRK